MNDFRYCVVFCIKQNWALAATRELKNHRLFIIMLQTVSIYYFHHWDFQLHSCKLHFSFTAALLSQTLQGDWPQQMQSPHSKRLVCTTVISCASYHSRSPTNSMSNFLVCTHDLALIIWELSRSGLKSFILTSLWVFGDSNFSCGTHRVDPSVSITGVCPLVWRLHVVQDQTAVSRGEDVTSIRTHRDAVSARNGGRQKVRYVSYTLGTKNLKKLCKLWKVYLWKTYVCI